MHSISDLFTNTDIEYFLGYEKYLYIGVFLLVIILSKFLYDMVTPYKVDHELTTSDNKSIAICFGSYLFSIGIIIFGVISGEGSDDLKMDLLNSFLWGVIGIVALGFTAFINDKIILRGFSVRKELLEDQNPAAAMVISGGYLASAFIINALIRGDSNSFATDIIEFLILFITMQILLIVYAYIHQFVSSYHLFYEIEEDNAAAGISFGLSLVAIGLYLSRAIEKSSELLFIILWFILGVSVIYLLRFFIDKIIFPNHQMDKEISDDRNWGVAFIEGALNIIVLLLLSAAV